MDQYTDAFRNEKISGTVLVQVGDEELNDLGVSSPLHCFKIQFLFKRFLQKTPTTHAMEHIYDFLAANNMDMYRERFVKEGVDGDMLLGILQLNPDVRNPILHELGIMKKLHVLKIKLFNPEEEPKP